MIAIPCLVLHESLRVKMYTFVHKKGRIAKGVNHIVYVPSAPQERTTFRTSLMAEYCYLSSCGPFLLR